MATAISSSGGVLEGSYYLKPLRTAAACVVETVTETTKIIFTYLGEVQAEPNALGRVLKLGQNLFISIELGTGKTGYFSSITSSFGKTREIIDIMQIFDGIGYFVGDRVEKDSWFGVMGNATMFVGALGSIVSFLDECHVLDLAEVAESLGSIPVLGAFFRLGISFEQVIVSVFTLGFAFFSGDAIGEMVDEELSSMRKRQAALNLAWNVAEIAAAIFVICAATQVIGVIVLGTIASTLGIVAFLHRAWVEQQEKKLLEEKEGKEEPLESELQVEVEVISTEKNEGGLSSEVP